MSRAVSPTSSAAFFAARPDTAHCAAECSRCGSGILPRRAELGYDTCLKCAESAPRYRADCATTREGQVLELALHLSDHQYRSWQQYQKRPSLNT